MKTVSSLLAMACLLGPALAASAQQTESLNDMLTYKISSAALKQIGQNKCIDIFNGGPLNNQVHLQDCANYSGQLWHLTNIPTALRYLPTYSLTTDFRGPQMCLTMNGTPADNLLQMKACPDIPDDNQLWVVMKVDGGWQITPYLDEAEGVGSPHALTISQPPSDSAPLQTEDITKVGNGYIWALTPVQ